MPCVGRLFVLIKIVIRGEYRLPLAEVLREGLKQFPNGDPVVDS